MKKLVVLAMAALMAAGLMACGNTGSGEMSQEAEVIESTVQEGTEAGSEGTVAADRPVRIATKPMTEQ